MYDVNAVRGEFPILARGVNGKPLVYLDNGASAQKPQAVIDAVIKGYAEEYSNVHRGLHYLSNLSTEKYEAVRNIVARFLGVGRSRRDCHDLRQYRGSEPRRLWLGDAADRAR